MNGLRILVLLLYYERPTLVQNALNSVLRADKLYANWHLAFIDDSSPTPGRPIAESILRDKLSQVTFYHSNCSVEEKRLTGSLLGKFMNQAIQECPADIVIMLCDDDELCPDYFLKLDEFFSIHKQVSACYSHVHLYNPAYEKSENVNNILVAPRFNDYSKKINPAGKVDASQVAWRSSLNRDGNIWFSYPKTKNLDEDFYLRLARTHGRIPFSGFIAQYKSHNQSQLRNVSENEVWDGRNLDMQNILMSTPDVEIVQAVNRYARQKKVNEAYRILGLGLSRFPNSKALRAIIVDEKAPMADLPNRTPRAAVNVISSFLIDKFVCDLGCGEGDFLVFISDIARQMVGFESNEKKCRFAQRRGLSVVHGDINVVDLPVADVYYLNLDLPFDKTRQTLKRLSHIMSPSSMMLLGSDIRDRLGPFSNWPSLISTPFMEGSEHRQSGIFFVAPFDISVLRARL